MTLLPKKPLPPPPRVGGMAFGHPPLGPLGGEAPESGGRPGGAGGEKRCSGQGPQGRSGQAGAGLLLPSQSESVSLEFPGPGRLASSLGSDAPEPRAQNREEQEEQQPLGQEAGVSRRLLREVGIWDRRQGERGSPQGGGGRPPARIPRGAPSSGPVDIPLQVALETCSNHRSPETEIQGAIQAERETREPLGVGSTAPHPEPRSGAQGPAGSRYSPGRN